MWTWTALDADSKLIVSWFRGERSGESAMVLMDDLRERVANQVQLTTGGHNAYLKVVEGAFGRDVDYAILVNRYGKTPIEGKPDELHISTSYVEHQNLAMRRFTRVTNAFSKKVDNHMHALALYFVFYNFIRLLKTPRMSPAMAAGITDRLWSMEDIAALTELKVAAKRVPTKHERGNH